MDKAEKEARNTWFGNDYFTGEGTDPFYQICFGRAEEFNPTRKPEFQELAKQIFEPLLACREKS